MAPGIGLGSGKGPDLDHLIVAHSIFEIAPSLLMSRLFWLRRKSSSNSSFRGWVRDSRVLLPGSLESRTNSFRVRGRGHVSIAHVIRRSMTHPSLLSVRFADKLVPLCVISNVSPCFAVPTKFAFDTTDGHATGAETLTVLIFALEEPIVILITKEPADRAMEH